MPQVTGIVTVYMNGKLLRSKEGAELDTGGYTREPVTGHSLYGYTEKFAPSSCKFTLAHMVDTDIDELNTFVDGTLRFETDVGLVYLVTSAFVTKPVVVKGGGDVDVETMGDPAQEE